jgi:hypothetical protein
MQTVMDPQSICDKLLSQDLRIMYSSFFNSEGSRVGEATRDLIGLREILTIMVLPLRPGKDERLVLAAPFGSDMIEIVAKAKSLLS